MELKTIALNDLHIALGGKMVPFAGYNMPVRYSSDIEEHLTVRNGVGVFDVSHMGEFLVSGNGATAFIQQCTSNDVNALTDGKVQYSTLTLPTGGIVDDLLVYRRSENNYLLVVNASNIDKDFNHLMQYKPSDVEMINVSDDWSLFAVQGPKATEALASLTELPLSSMPYYTFKEGIFAGVEGVIVSTTGYTGAGGFEIYVPNTYAETVWKAIFTAGEAQGIKPIGLGARDTLRLEMGFCLYGNDISDTTTPLEAGLGWITKLNTTFNGSDVLTAQKAEGIKRKLSGFVMLEKAIPRSHYKIESETGEVLGEVCSGSQSPVLNQGIGMGYLPIEFSKPGTKIFIDIRGRKIPAEVRKTPFI